MHQSLNKIAKKKVGVFQASVFKASVFKVSLGVLMAISLTACNIVQSKEPQETAVSKDPAKAVVLPLNDVKLQNYVWQLQSVTDSDGNVIIPELINSSQGTLQLQFDEDYVQFLNTCNRMSADYILTNHDIELTPVRSTLMACDEQGSAFDAAAAQVVKGQFKLTLNQHQQPILTVYGDGHTAIFSPIKK